MNYLEALTLKTFQKQKTSTRALRQDF